MSKIFPVVALVQVAVTASLVVSTLPSQRDYNPADRQYAGDDHQSPTKWYVAPVEKQHTPPVGGIARNGNATNKEQQVDEWVSSDWVTAISAVVQAIAAAIMVGFTVSLLKYTRRTWKVGIRNARSAKRSADVASATLKITQRAWLHVVDFEFGPHLKSRVPTAVARLQNTGHLPAAIKEFSITLWYDDPLPPHTPDIEREWVNGGGIAPPGKPVELKWTFDDVTFSDSEWKRILTGDKPTSFYGAVKYKTGFDDLPGETGFAFTYDAGAVDKPHNRRFAVSDDPSYCYAH